MLILAFIIAHEEIWELVISLLSEIYGGHAYFLKNFFSRYLPLSPVADNALGIDARL